jgi:uncharacterized NAD(P)/FAD-binding protein YdhS
LKKHENIRFKHIRGEALDINLNREGARILIEGVDDIQTDVIVLARGNSLPKNPLIQNKSTLRHYRYIRNPWNPDIFKNLRIDDDIVFIGSGQTMVDLVTGLYKKKHRGRMIAISRRGFLPFAHKKLSPYPSFFDELKGHKKLLPIIQIVRKHMAIAKKTGIDIRSVIDSLRPYTTKIWMQLPAAEKKRFLRHLFRYWEILRSRIPPESDQIIRKLQSKGQLIILTGIVKDFVPVNDVICMFYRPRGTKDVKSVSCDWIVNCIGPNLDYNTLNEPLIRNLLDRGLIRCDPAHLGLDAFPDGSVIQADGSKSDVLYAIGPPLKGILWESIATPEIRVQAENLAQKLLINN